MTDTNNQPKRKLIDWDKKNSADSDRISKRSEKRKPNKKSGSTDNPTRPPRATGIPLMRLRQKIKEVYDDDEEDDELYFNISLIGDEQNEAELSAKRATDTLTIARHQELTGKLGLIMNTALIAQDLGLPAKVTAKDNRLANTPEYDETKITKKSLNKKVEKPLKLEGELPLVDLEDAITGLKQAVKTMPSDSLAGYPADEAEMLASLDEEDMAKLILKKSGRSKAPKTKKKLSEIAKGLNQFKEWEQSDNKTTENQ